MQCVENKYIASQKTGSVFFLQGVDISVTACLFICLCVFVRLLISPPRIMLAASHFARRFTGVQGRKSWGTLLPRKSKIGRIGQRTGHAHLHVNITVEMRRRKRYARGAPFVKSRGVWT